MGEIFTDTTQDNTDYTCSDTTQDTGGNNTVSCNCNISEVQSILTEIQTSQKDFEELTAKYQEETLENDKVLIEQSKNLLSVSSLLLLTVGFLSGILLARIVWRKL